MITPEELKIELEYMERLSEYNLLVAQLKFQRDQFYAQNPACPNKTMFMNVLHPPQQIKFVTIN